MSAEGADAVTELEFGEFCEVLLRIGQLRIPVDELTVPFGVAFEAWLAHEVLPRARIARQRRLVTGGV